MYKSFIFFMVVVINCFSCSKDNNSNDSYVEITISMDPNSTSDVFYDLPTGTKKVVQRTAWDIAFSVPLQTATIRTNEGAGVELYCVGDTSDWLLINENTISNLSPRFNDKSDWLVGAFNLGASGFPNYGWGTYHFGNPDHNVGGDSLFVIKLTDGSFKKLMVRAKLGSTASSIIRWASLDGTDELVDTIPTAAYADIRNFVYYSISNMEVVEVEPDMAEWNLLFTRYIIRLPSGPGVFMNYPVMGVLSNSGTTVAKVTGMVPQQATDTDATGGYSIFADAIGYDWKLSDPQTHAISLVDSTSYFVQLAGGLKYQLYFTNYGGNAAGTISFRIKPVE